MNFTYHKKRTPETYLDQELLVLSFQRQREPVDDGPEDLQELAHPVEVFRLVDELQEKVVYLLPDEGPEPEELPVDPVQHRLQKVPLSRVLAVEELEQLQHELLVDHLLPNAGLEVGRLQEPQEELVHQLQWKSFVNTLSENNVQDMQGRITKLMRQ